MKEELIKLAAYLETLETHLSSLDARINALEERFDAVEKSHETKQNLDTSVFEAIRQLHNLVERNTYKVNNLGEALAEVNARIDDEELDMDDPLETAINEEQEQDFEPEQQPKQTPQEEPQTELLPESQPAPLPTPQPAPAPTPKPAPTFGLKQTGARTGTPVTDIRHAISLGDRFLFQRELFGQNGELMQTTLEALNNQVNFEATIVYLDTHFPHWDKETSTYELFLNVLHRRFQ